MTFHAQEKPKSYVKVGCHYNYGLIIPQFGLLDPIDEKPFQSLNISLVKRTSGRNAWNQLYNYPEFGLNLFFVSLGHNEVLGNLIGADYFFKINFIDHSKFQLYTNTGFGMGYANRRFDTKNNPLNIALGSHFNFHFNFGLGAGLNITRKTKLQVGGSFDHFSNANTAFPNDGINAITMFGGITHNIQPEVSKTEFDIPEHIRKVDLELIVNFGAKNRANPSANYFLNPSLSFDLNHNTFRVLNFGIGFDLFYDTYVKMDFESKNKSYYFNNGFTMGFHLNQSFVYDRFRFIFQEGSLLYKIEGVNKHRIYNRVIFKYQLTKTLSTHLALKSYLHNLDYVEIGVGYLFRN